MQRFLNKEEPGRSTRPLLLLAGITGAIVFAAFVTITTTSDLPLLADKTQIFGWVVAAGICVLVVTIARGDAGLGLSMIAAVVLIAKTGMQLEMGGIRTSALELLIVVATLMIFLRRAFTEAAPQWPKLLIDRPLLLFVCLTLPALLIAMVRDVPATNILTEVKGYYLYPCFAYLMVAWIRTPRRWQIVAAVGLVAALVIALIALSDWTYTSPNAVATFDPRVNRASGSFGIVNQYSFYVSTMTLVALGWMAGARSSFTVFALAAVGVVLILAMTVSGSRACWIGLGAGLIVFIWFRPPRKLLWVPAVVFAAGSFYLILPSIQTRLQLNPESDQFRSSMLSLGIKIFLEYPIFGCGWGASFWENSSGVLQPGINPPWMHNDYLNLLTQVGLVGFVPFVALWVQVIKRSVKHIRTIVPQLKWPMIGCLGALVALLLEAGTDHVFWRPDIAGQVWWLAGLLLAGIRIDSE